MSTQNYDGIDMMEKRRPVFVCACFAVVRAHSNSQMN